MAPAVLFKSAVMGQTRVKCPGQAFALQALGQAITVTVVVLILLYLCMLTTIVQDVFSMLNSSSSNDVNG